MAKVRDRRESLHEEIVAYFQNALRENKVVCTTDYVLTEILTLLFKRPPFQTAWEGYQQIESARRNDFLEVEWIGRDRFERAIDLRE